MRLMFAGHAYVRLPVVCVGEVFYDCGVDAGYAPLAVVPSSGDDRELRPTQPLLVRYVMRRHKNNAV